MPRTFQCLADLRWSLPALLEVPTSCSVGFPVEQRDQHAWRWPWPRPDDRGPILSTPTIRAHLGSGRPPVPLRSWGRGTGRANPTCAPGPGQNRPLQTGHCWPRGAGAPTPRKHCALASEEDTCPSRAPLCRSPRLPASHQPCGGPDSCSHPSAWCCPACPGRRLRSFPPSLWNSGSRCRHADPRGPHSPGVSRGWVAMTHLGLDHGSAGLQREGRRAQVVRPFEVRTFQNVTQVSRRVLVRQATVTRREGR